MSLLHRPTQVHFAWQTDTHISEKHAVSFVRIISSEHEDSNVFQNVDTSLPGYAEDGRTRFLLVPTCQMT
jgi:hypothetical protein